jgi:hypothetical protein
MNLLGKDFSTFLPEGIYILLQDVPALAQVLSRAALVGITAQSGCT